MHIEQARLIILVVRNKGREFTRLLRPLIVKDVQYHTGSDASCWEPVRGLATWVQTRHCPTLRRCFDYNLREHSCSAVERHVAPVGSSRNAGGVGLSDGPGAEKLPV